MNGKIYGELVAGTELEFLAPAPSLSALQRAPQGWFHCLRCGNIKMIRRQYVKAGHTVSCGCKGKKLFIAKHEAIAEAMSTSTRKAVFAAAYARGEKKMYRYGTATKFRLSKYVVDFLIAKHQRFLSDVVALGKHAVALLSRTERHWLPRFAKNAKARACQQAREAAWAAVPWREREALLAKQRHDQDKSWKMMQRMMAIKDCNVGQVLLDMMDAGAEVSFSASLFDCAELLPQVY